MSGIVGIGEVVSKTEGLINYLNLIGILSLAIGVANVMPFPPLDGGKIVIVLCEAIVRKKLPLKAEAIISYIGFALLILLTLVVTYNDILRVF
ncbi:Regulator of sigma-W protease RasP [compost metagenome]